MASEVPADGSHSQMEWVFCGNGKVANAFIYIVKLKNRRVWIGVQRGIARTRVFKKAVMSAGAPFVNDASPAALTETHGSYVSVK